MHSSVPGRAAEKSTLGLRKTVMKAETVRVLSRRLHSVPDVKPFNSIPSPPDGARVPFIGQASIIFGKPHGRDRFYLNLKDLHEKYTVPGVDMLRFKAWPMNPIGSGRVLMVTEPRLVREVYRNEGPHPFRGSGLEVQALWRKSRPDLFPETLGVLLEEGTKWHEVRSLVQQDMMRAQSAFFYLDKIHSVAKDFVTHIRRVRSDKERDYLQDMHAYSFESISTIALDTRIGCFDENPSPEARRVMKAVSESAEAFGLALSGSKLQLWRIAPWLDSNYRRMARGLDIFGDYAKARVNETVERIKAKGTSSTGDCSILEKLIHRCGPESSIPFTMAFDMTSAGIDTTGNSLGFILYHLSRHPAEQQRLRDEVLAHPVTPAGLNRMRFLRAFIKESFRMSPLVAIMVRMNRHADIVLNGFHVPKNTFICWPYYVLARHPESFPDPEVFRPDRWLTERDTIHPFTVLPYSHGPRSCLGKRFADLEMQLLLIELVRNFRLEWAGPSDREMRGRWRLILAPDMPLHFRFEDL